MTTSEIIVPTQPWHRSLCWGAIIAGVVAATALQFLFLMLGTGLGFSAYDPITSDDPLASLGKGALVIQGVSAVLSLWFGGWVAGRFTPLQSRATGGHHGFLVWCASMVTGALIVVLGAGWMIGGTAKLAGAGLSTLGQPVAGEVAEAAKSAVQRSSDTVKSYLDEAVASNRAGVRTGQTVRAEREIGFALTRLFRANQADNAEARATAIRILDENSTLSATEATTMVDEWMADYRELQAELRVLKAEAELKAREAAEKASHALAAFSLISFFAFLLGSISATCGGKHGAKCATRRETVVVLN